MYSQTHLHRSHCISPLPGHVIFKPRALGRDCRLSRPTVSILQSRFPLKSPSRRDHTSTQCEGPVLLLLKREAKMISPYLILATVVHDRTLPPRRDSDWIGAPVRFYNKKREGKGRVGLWWKG